MKRPTIARYNGPDAGLHRQREKLNNELDRWRHLLAQTEREAQRFNEAVAAIAEHHPAAEGLRGYWAEDAKAVTS